MLKRIPSGARMIGAYPPYDVNLFLIQVGVIVGIAVIQIVRYLTG